MNDESSNDGSHGGGAYKKSVSILEGRTRLKLENEVVIDPRVFPSEEIAAVHEHVQA